MTLNRKSLLITTELTRQNILELLKLTLHDVNQIFFYGQALASIQHMSLGHKIQLHQWAQQADTVGYCGSVVARYDCHDMQLHHWQEYGLTEFYAKLHDANALEQF